MLGFFRPAPESVHFIDMREGKISFLLSRARVPGTILKVRFPLIPAAQTRRLDVTVEVTACRQARGAVGYVCIAEPRVPADEMAHLAQTLALYCVSGARDMGEVRQSDRSPIGLRVLGRQVPYYRAVASDLSPGGVRLHCQGELEIGVVVELKIELDMPGMKDFLSLARVVWSTCDELKTQCTAGLQFLELDRRRQIHLQRYLEAVKERASHENQVKHRLSGY